MKSRTSGAVILFAVLILALFSRSDRCGHAVAQADFPAWREDTSPGFVYLPLGVYHFGSGITPVNRPPYAASNPIPANGASDQSPNVGLSWTGGDPDGDRVIYDVYLEADDSTPDHIECADVASTSCDPGALSYETHYYWQVVAKDEHSAATWGVVWHFRTAAAPNDPPLVPANPVPADGATDQDVRALLSWTGGDPDGDSVTYDIYLAADSSNRDDLVCSDRASATCDPGGLYYGTHYHWRVTATDARGAKTIGPVWEFTTNPAPVVFSEDFGPDMSFDWQVFTLPDGPFADDWHWEGKGHYWYWPGEIGEEDRWTKFALSMLLGEDTQDWTDYEVVATLRDDYRRGDKGLTGLWFRGTYQDGIIGGYYVHMKPADNPPSNSNKLYLWRFPPGSSTLDDAQLLQSFEYPGDIKFLNPYQMKVRVEGDRIRVWFKHNLEPESDYVLAFDVRDGTYPRGTIGLSGYKSMSFFYSVEVTALSAGNP